ncbi:hypothetical protein CcaverHIS002_0111000 [Cutaneotrichosporon cavernicola]|uniref:Uncharacterized protein n=1 Tax=Cutaneotrichosporon cavernicola TaxID=279322 RepID=A0AA48L145_9TREE|nr:uncharacterized protein CcaverHIS019_0110900 [Cutaneotrichosporon cavernicola]BEI80571.1 hypothetical protein CcaverHIS002_0111000 [Cutaneotrichosporon cavernicola]BEI88372.1 hypothetical protein CcaverHIS019_0110900 [Cutaneotrichosporon cavernicola]BEI96145.1 hypothetical protein CcaverHIS631_0110940 [Cutaneotrichosporon cavernicola]BEJ03917.1 hypothetical protein CcaverHIS641_0110920 [Cutaneotrichosporon cavernicola]
MDRRTTLRLSVVLNVLLLLSSPLYVIFRQTAFKELEVVDKSDSFRFSEELAQVPSTPPNPVFECGMGEAGPIGRRLTEELGDVAMRRSVAYSGSNHRLRRTLAKMRAGEPFSMGVIGGSVSAGHGMDRSKEYMQSIMHQVLFDYLNSKFPSAQPAVDGRHTKNSNRNVYWNGAQRARGSDYFSFCASLHLNTDVDLVIVELAVNDRLDPVNIKHFENLMRYLLQLPSQPAVLVVNTFALMFWAIATGGDLNFGNAQYYDLPVVSARNVVLPSVLQNYTRLGQVFNTDDWKPMKPDLSNADLRHFGKEMHIITGELMISYIESQLCEMDRLEYRRPDATSNELYPVDPIPRLRLQDKYEYDAKDFPKLEPKCATTNSDEFPLVPVKQDGWRPWAWKGKKKYLIADRVGATITFEFTTVVGVASLYYLRSWEFPLGKLRCWVDGIQGTAQVSNGRWDKRMNIGDTTEWSGLTPGSHTLDCEIIASTDDPTGKHEFRLISLMTL